MATSSRKPHSDYKGYVCERKSHHPDLPGHFVVLDRDKGGAWAFGGDGDRWAVMYEPSNDASSTLVTLPTKRSATDLMKHAAAGGNDADFGQN